MPWKAPIGKGGLHVSRARDGSTRVKGMAPPDPPNYRPTPAEIAEDEFDRFAALMSMPPAGIIDGRRYFDTRDDDWSI